jgi:Uma2 family endonuclease
LTRWFSRRLPDEFILAVESTLYLNERTFVEPDITIYPSHILPEDVRGPDLRLAIEIGDTSLSFDLKAKAPLYSRYRIAHYWAIDAESLTTYAHSAPTPDGYRTLELRTKDEQLIGPFAPQLVLSLAELK